MFFPKVIVKYFIFLVHFYYVFVTESKFIEIYQGKDFNIKNLFAIDNIWHILIYIYTAFIPYNKFSTKWCIFYLLSIFIFNLIRTFLMKTIFLIPKVSMFVDNTVSSFSYFIISEVITGKFYYLWGSVLLERNMCKDFWEIYTFGLALPCFEWSSQLEQKILFIELNNLLMK